MSSKKPIADKTNKAAIARQSANELLIRQRLNNALQSRLPDLSESELRKVAERLIDYIATNLMEGWEIAVIKEIDGALDLKVLSIIEEKKIALNQDKK